LRKSLVVLSALLVALVLTGAVSAQVRGTGRLQGVVTDKATGKPVADATVVLNLKGGNTAPITTKTDSKGRWAALGMLGGNWDVDISAAGYDTQRGSAAISELQRLPTVQTQLVPAAKQEPAPAAEAPTQVGSGVAKEIVEAVRAGEELMKQEKYKEAVPQFEKAMAGLPDNVQLKQVLAQAYYKAGDLKKAIGMLEQVTSADPTNIGASLLLVNLYLENKQLSEGKLLLDGLPAGSVTDPTVYTNVGILFLNGGKQQDAWNYFDKAVTLDSKGAENYYYRGLAALQLKKTKEAKADFEQVIALAPDSAEARDSKQLLAGLK
jgi:tetratricopeptide (TPR) repeat protein